MVLEPKDQLITENDLTLKPSVENNHSLTYLSCCYSWDIGPVAFLRWDRFLNGPMSIATSI